MILRYNAFCENYTPNDPAKIDDLTNQPNRPASMAEHMPEIQNIEDRFKNAVHDHPIRPSKTILKVKDANKTNLYTVTNDFVMFYKDFLNIK